MQIAIAAIGIAVALMVGYVVVAYVEDSLPTDGLNESVTTGIQNARETVFSGFNLIAVGVIVLAAFGLISVFRS